MTILSDLMVGTYVSVARGHTTGYPIRLFSPITAAADSVTGVVVTKRTVFDTATREKASPRSMSGLGEKWPIFRFLRPVHPQYRHPTSVKSACRLRPNRPPSMGGFPKNKCFIHCSLCTSEKVIIDTFFVYALMSTFFPLWRSFGFVVGPPRRPGTVRFYFVPRTIFDSERKTIVNQTR